MLILAAAFFDRFRKGKLGPMQLEIDPAQQARETTSELAARPGRPSPDQIGPNEEDDATRWALAEKLVSDFLLSPPPPLEDCHFQLYLYDEDNDLLSPILRPGHEGPSPDFKPGQGATGLAWDREEYVSAEGDETSDATFGLSNEQQVRYADLTAVAALPVTTVNGETIAILSASTRDAGTKLLTEEGLQTHVFLAEATARILVTCSSGSTTVTIRSPLGRRTSGGSFDEGELEHEAGSGRPVRVDDLEGCEDHPGSAEDDRQPQLEQEELTFP